MHCLYFHFGRYLVHRFLNAVNQSIVVSEEVTLLELYAGRHEPTMQLMSPGEFDLVRVCALQGPEHHLPRQHAGLQVHGRADEAGRPALPALCAATGGGADTPGAPALRGRSGRLARRRTQG